MRKTVWTFLMGIGWGLVGCTQAASEQELQQMCAHLQEVRGDVPAANLKEKLARIEEEFAAKARDLRTWKARDMKGWDEELKVKIELLSQDGQPADPAKVAALKAEYAKKKEIGAKQFADDMAALEPAKQEAIAKAKAKMAEAEAELKQKIKDCIDAAHQEGVDQQTAKCRIAAPDKDTYWNKCR